MAEKFRRKYIDVEAEQFDGTKASQDELVAFAEGKTAGTVVRSSHKGSWNDATPEPSLTMTNPGEAGIEIVKGEWLVVDTGRLARYDNDRFTSQFEWLAQ